LGRRYKAVAFATGEAFLENPDKNMMLAGEAMV
jgi:hypothetical protein